MSPDRRHLIQLAAASLASMACPAFAQAAAGAGGKPLMLLVPYPAGGLSDNIARRINTPLGAALGKTVLVDNLGGASGSIAAQKVRSAPADGQLLFQGSPNELILAPLAIASVKYKPEDFRQVHAIAISPMAIFTRAELPVNNADELAAHAAQAAKDGKPLTYASVGNGSFYHLLGGHMASILKVNMTHVPYKGAADAFRDLSGGMVDIFITPYGPAQVELIRQGRVKAVAVLSPKRQRLLPDIASTTESQALKSFSAEISTGYFLRRDTPEAVIQPLHQALQKTLGDAQLAEALTAMGQEVSPPQSLDEADAAYKRDIAHYQGIARAIGIKPNS